MESPAHMTPEALRRQERAILYYTCVAHALTHVYMLIFPAVLEPMRTSFGLDRKTFLEYATISTVLFGLGALPAGWLGDRLGERRMLAAFFFLTAAGGTILGLASGVWALAVGMAVLGLGTSIFHPVGNALISKGIRSPGKAMGVNGLWGSLGTAAGPVLAITVAFLLDWRWAYLVLTAPMVILGALLLRTPMSTEEEGEARARAGAASGASASSEPKRRSVPIAKVVVVSLLLLAMTCGGLYFHLITTMLPKHLEEQIGSLEAFQRLADGLLTDEMRSRGLVTVAALQAGLVTGLVYAIGGLGQILSGHLVHRFEGRGVYVVVLLLATPLIFAMSRLEQGGLFVTSALMAICIFAVQPVENILLARHSPPRVRGVLFGAKFVLAFGIGGLGPGISGWVSDRWSIAAVFVVASAMSAVAAVVAFIAWVIRD